MPRPLHEVRQELRDWLADLEALRPFADPAPGAPNRGFLDAWSAAREEALKIAAEYAQAIRAGA